MPQAMYRDAKDPQDYLNKFMNYIVGNVTKQHAHLLEQ